MMSLRDYEIYLLFLLLVKFHGSGGVNVSFTQEPSNPSYFNNGSDANLVWNYTDPLNEVKSVLYKVVVDGDQPKKMIVKNSGGVQESAEIPPSYQGRVKIEGRATLVIKNINPGDNTNFICELTGSFLDTFQSTVKLIVAGSDFKSSPEQFPSLEAKAVCIAGSVLMDEAGTSLFFSPCCN